MGNWQIGFPDDAYSYTVAAQTEAAAYPAVNAKRAERPLLTWRSTTGGTQWLRGYLGATAVPVAGLDLFNTNATSYTVETSDDASTWTTRRTSTNTAANPWTARRNVRCVLASVVNCKYVRVSLTHATAAYLEVGGFVPFAAFQTFDQNFGSLAVEVRQAQTITQYLGGGAEVNSEGALQAVYRLGKEHWRRSGNNALGLLQRLARVSPNLNIHIADNNGNESEVYCMRRAEVTPATIGFVTVGQAMTFEERV